MIPNLVRRILVGVFSVFFGVIGLIMLFRVPTAIFIIYVALALIMVCMIKDKGFIVLIIVGSFLIRLVYIHVIDTPPESDFKLLYDAAVLFSQGDYSFNQYQYFQDWAYQTGFVIYQGTVIKLFGYEGSIFALKILNCLWNTGITLLIYLMARNFFKERSSRLAALLYMGFIFPITFVSVLSNQHISAFFILLGLFFLVDQTHLKIKPISRGFAAGFFLALGNIMRPEALIVMSSLLVYFLALLLRANNRRRRMERFMQCLAVFLIYLTVNSLASQAIIRSGVNEEGLKNNNFYWKFVVGLNYESRGRYNEYDNNLIFSSGLSDEEREEVQKDQIRERLSVGPLKLGNLFMLKIQSLWCDSALDWSYKHILKSNKPVHLFFNPVKFSDIDAVLKDLNELFIHMVIILSLLGMLAHRKSRLDDGLLVSVAILVASFVVYLFIEVQPRYAYLQQPFLFILSGAGMDFLSDRLDASTLRVAWKRLLGSRVEEKGEQKMPRLPNKSIDN